MGDYIKAHGLRSIACGVEQNLTEFLVRDWPSVRSDLLYAIRSKAEYEGLVAVTFSGERGNSKA